jgi:UDP-GlcNAc:undecaprenyl-phosphate GlcNAc-1-phosphate transferase
MYLLIVFCISLLTTFFSTPFFIDFFTKHKIIDLPGGRRINTHAVPRMGGLVIYFTSILSIIIFYGNLEEIKYFIFGSALVLAVGGMDDIKDLDYKKKFLVEFIAAAFLVAFLSPANTILSFFGSNIPYPFDKIILIIFIVGVVNAINHYDGLDGLVTGFSLLVVIVTFVIGWQLDERLLLILSVSLIGSLIGFLKYNAYPAKIFLGDCGSLTLGFFLVTASLISSKNVDTGNVDLTFSVILLATPVIDTLRVIVVRIKKGRNPFISDTSHVHHIILGSNIKLKSTVFILQGFSILFVLNAILYLNNFVIGLAIFAFLALMLLSIKKILIGYKEIGKRESVKKLYMKVLAFHNKFLS